MFSIQRALAIGAILAVAALSMAGPAVSPAHATKVCKVTGIIGQSIAPTEKKAKRRAKKDWKKKITQMFDASWANWKLANKKWTFCTIKPQGHHCMKSGFPCKDI